MSEEMRFHLEMEAKEHVADGASAAASPWWP